MTETTPSAEKSSLAQPESRDDFLDLLRRSELLDPAALERWENGPGSKLVSAAESAASLMASRLLTDWQCQKLLDGRWKGFFLGKYKILDHLGAGAMGRVYLAEHRVMRRQVALKVLAKRLSGRLAYIQRFQQEARAAGAVNNPRIVKAFDIDCEEDLHFIVMEFVDGVDLQKIVLQDGPLPIQIAAETARQIAEGLAAVHRAGLIHRDIKPANVLLDKAGDVHVLDLGLARLSDSDEPSLTLVHDTKLIGTVDYLAPEQARNSHEIDSRADLYSLGGTLYFLLSGQPPFNEGTLPQRVAMHLTTPPMDIRQRRTDTPAELARICHKLLEKDPARRYQCAEDVVSDLRAFLGARPAAGASPTQRSRTGYKPTEGELSFADPELPTAPTVNSRPPSSHNSPAKSSNHTQNKPAGSSTGAPTGSKAQAPSQPRINKPAKRGSGSDVLSSSQLSSGKLTDNDLAAATPYQVYDPGCDTALVGGADSLAGLLEEIMPATIVSQANSNPLSAPAEASLNKSPALPAANSAMNIQNRANYGALSPTSITATDGAPAPYSSLYAYEALLRRVTSGEGDLGGFRYQTWFLVAVGLLIGGIIGYVILFAFLPDKSVPQKRNLEQPVSISPPSPPPAPPGFAPAVSPPNSTAPAAPTTPVRRRRED
jgi:serine/threonine protein kinase